MPPPKPNKNKEGADRLSPAEQRAVEKFTRGLQQSLGPLRRAGEQIEELLGRWEQLSDTPGLLGGNLLTLMNEAVLRSQLKHLSETAARGQGQPADLAEHADFFGGLLCEYAALLNVLANIELEPESPLAEDWEKIAGELLQRGNELQQLAEELEMELESDEEEEGSTSRSAGLRTASGAFFHELWENSRAGVPLSGEAARLAEAMQEHPEYRVAWESADELGEQEYTIDGVNPFVHVSMHVAVERQLADGDPPETAATLARLTAAGLDRHAAVHRIADALVEQINHMQREHRNFDRAAYLRALKELKAL